MICEYGCGRKAKYPPRKGMTKWCCNDYFSKCPAVIKKQIIKNTGKKRSKQTVENLRNGRKGIKNKPPIFFEKSNKICEFGCNREAHYFFSITKRWCCEPHVPKCPKKVKETSERLKGHCVSSETKKKISKKIIQLNIENEEYRLKQSLTRIYKANDYRRVYPFFARIEEIRDDPKTGLIQVHCKNHKCRNSKEKCGWFTPTGIQLYERIRQLEKKNGNGGSYLYCSDKCKNECPLFNLKSDPFNNIEKLYTEHEYQTFRKFVLDRDNYVCQYCGETANHVHHERPQKLEPFFALDPYFAWSCCEECHYQKGHPTDSHCSTGNLANKLC